MRSLPVRSASIGGIVALLAGPAVTQEFDLLARSREIFQRLPKDFGTPEFPVVKERVQLGRALFFDPRISIDANISCATCHQPALYGTDGLAKSIGVKQRPHPRHAPTVLNTAGQFVIHWKGDRTNVEDQVIQALTSPITLGQPDPQAAIGRVQRIPG